MFKTGSRYALNLMQPAISSYISAERKFPISVLL